MGSWQQVDTDSIVTLDDMVVQSRTTTLTFTKSRFIQHNRYLLEDGSTREFSGRSGTWASTDTTITKTYHGLERGDDGFLYLSDEPQSVEKEYVWGDPARNTLLVHLWSASEPNSLFERYTRLDPLSGGITGVWRSTDETVEVTIEDDHIEISSRASDEASYTLAGDLTHDPDEGFLFVTVTSVEGNPDIAAGHELKFAYAQTGSNSIVVSTYADEREFDEDAMMWVDLTDPPYLAFGHYALNLVKQQ